MIRNNKQAWRSISIALVTLAFVLTLTMQTSTPQAQFRGNPGNPGIIPPNAKPHGLTYGEWGARWWQWLLSIPADVNPNLDPTGGNCGQGQSGHVWFLPGSFGGTSTRTCAVPTGKALFMPVLNAVFGSGVFDCEPTNPGVPCDVPTLRAGAASWMDDPVLLEVTIDGVPLQNLTAYRATSPEPFSIAFPEDAVFGLPSGIRYPHVSDGYWLMLTPLPPGTHTIHTKVISNATLGFAAETTLTLVVGK
jgi:hypothetical protein